MGELIETKKCWRCQILKLKKNFYHNYNELRNNCLNICNDCIKEESSITGESLRELRGIYTHLQRDYKDKIDESHYKRFWEKAIL